MSESKPEVPADEAVTHKEGHELAPGHVAAEQHAAELPTFEDPSLPELVIEPPAPRVTMTTAECAEWAQAHGVTWDSENKRLINHRDGHFVDDSTFERAANRMAGHPIPAE